MNAKDAWLATIGQLQIQLNRSTFDTWLRHAELLGHEDGRFVVTVPHAYAKDWIDRHLLASMTRTLSDIFQRECDIQIIVWDPVDDDEPGTPLLGYPDGSAALDDNPAAEKALGALHPDYTFETFMTGQTNHYAALLARAIVDSPIGKYSPVLFHGDIGVGKTHLLQAIARCLIEQGNTVIYTTCEDFTTELVSTIRGQDNHAFRDKYRNADAVIIDDLQFVEGKTSTYNEIVGIWDALRTRQKAIIFGSNRLPCDMVKLSKDARSRFQAGPIATLDTPDLALRLSILDAKIAQRGILLTPDVRSLIAAKLTSARDIESATEQLRAYSQLTGKAIDATSARMALKWLGSVVHHDSVTLSGVFDATAKYFRLTVDDLTSRKRTKLVAHARQVAMYLAREETDASLLQIGQALDGRDHSTIVHGCARITAALAGNDKQSAEITQDVAAIRALLNGSVTTLRPDDQSDRVLEVQPLAASLPRRSSMKAGTPIA